MNYEHYKQLLLEKERDLRSEIQRFQEEARDSRVAEVGDLVDAATSGEQGSESLQKATQASDTLALVEDALRRVEEGTYGKCIDCGRAIEPARLEAIPWTPYCLEDQEKHDAAQQPAGGSLSL